LKSDYDWAELYAEEHKKLERLDSTAAALMGEHALLLGHTKKVIDAVLKLHSDLIPCGTKATKALMPLSKIIKEMQRDLTVITWGLLDSFTVGIYKSEDGTLCVTGGRGAVFEDHEQDIRAEFEKVFPARQPTTSEKIVEELKRIDSMIGLGCNVF